MLRDKVLTVLEENRGNPVSGGELAAALGVSRTAIWKAVNALREQGICILSREGRGYTLSKDDDTLTNAAIGASLKTSELGRNLLILESVSSTNIYLKELAQNNAPHGTTVIADTQEHGKGRMGRSFFSPPSSGLYISTLLRPSTDFPSISLITASAAVAVADSIEEVTGVSPEIKWVNDLQLEGKKLCGILTEASVEGESGMLQYAVCGIGINIKTPPEGYPSELRGIATSLSEHMKAVPLRAKLASAVLNNLETRYQQLAHSDIQGMIKAYRRRLSTLGKTVEVKRPRGRFTARALDIDDNVHLIVERSDGSRELLSAGEISIKG